MRSTTLLDSAFRTLQEPTTFYSVIQGRNRLTLINSLNPNQFKSRRLEEVAREAIDTNSQSNLDYRIILYPGTLMSALWSEGNLVKSNRATSTGLTKSGAVNFVPPSQFTFALDSDGQMLNLQESTIEQEFRCDRSGLVRTSFTLYPKTARHIVSIFGRNGLRDQSEKDLIADLITTNDDQDITAVTTLLSEVTDTPVLCTRLSR